MTDVTHLPDQSRFESGAAYLTYREADGGFDLQHTAVRWSRRLSTTPGTPGSSSS